MIRLSYLKSNREYPLDAYKDTIIRMDALLKGVNKVQRLSQGSDTLSAIIELCSFWVNQLRPGSYMKFNMLKTLQYVVFILFRTTTACLTFSLCLCVNQT